MANPEHVRIVKKGTEELRAWQNENRAVPLDLSGADLSEALLGSNVSNVSLIGADLKGVNLSHAQLYNVGFYGDLSNANFCEARLTDVNFGESLLWGADFSKATLDEVRFDGADLSGANLGRANLRNTSFRWAKLRMVNLGGARLGVVDFWSADLSGAKLGGALLRYTRLEEVNLVGADLRKATFVDALLRGANLSGADLSGAHLSEANLRGANLSKTNLSEANLSKADLSGADLTSAIIKGTNLTSAMLIDANMKGVILDGCNVYGISRWGTNLEGATQTSLVITKDGEPKIEVDNLDAAQFLYLLLHNERIRGALDVITRKIVLILGRFTPGRKPILDAIREQLRKHGYVPVMFDFDKPLSRNFIETVSTLAHLARFVIADFTDPKIVLQEVEHLVTALAVPIMPILLKSSQEPISLVDWRKGRTYVLDTFFYQDIHDLLASLRPCVIEPAEEAARRLTT